MRTLPQVSQWKEIYMEPNQLSISLRRLGSGIHIRQLADGVQLPRATSKTQQQQ